MQTTQTLTRQNAAPGIIIGMLASMMLFFFCATAYGAAPEMTDRDIAEAVEREMATDPMVPAVRIDAAAADGVVALTGEVDSLLAKERAGKIAGTVRGVRSVVNKILVVVPDSPKSDLEIREDVEDALELNAATDTYEIDVGVANHVVSLSGTVDSWQEKQLAGKVVKGVEGVYAVENGISAESEEKRPDWDIRSDVESRLRWSARVDDARIAVQVADGKVRLTGTVGSAAEKNLAVANAWVEGARSVDASGLEAASGAERRSEKDLEKTDEAIRDAVTEALAYEPLVDAYNVGADIDDGVLTLRGTVADLQAKRAAAGTARRTLGVVRVKNRLKVRPAGRLSDPAVKGRVEKALSFDPVIDPSRIDIAVENGVANLTGVVDTFYEKAAADERTAQVSGIVSVDNNLTVTDPSLYYYDPYVDDWYMYDYDWYAYDPVRTFMSDPAVKESIENEYFWSPFVDGGDIDVSVESGTATLTGHVDSWPEKYAAEENAREGGAIWVDNNLTVR